MSDHETGRSKEKIVYLEVCRITAVFCIMYQHTGGRGADAWVYTESAWVYASSLIGTIISSIGVPLFWMVSGALLLPKRESWRNVYGKRIPRFAGVLILVSVIRYFYLCTVEEWDGHVGEFFWRFYTQEIFLPYWFLYEYLGVLFVLPFLRKMMQNLTEQEEMMLVVLVTGWNILNDNSHTYLGVGFVLNLHFQSSISYFMLGYLMENCRMLRQRGKDGVRFDTGLAVFTMAALYRWGCGQHGLEELGSLIMLLTIAVYDLIRCVSEKSIWNNTVLHRLILWCGSNVFGIYLIEDYLRNLTAFIWEWSAPHISAVPACGVWLLAVFLIGNVLVSGLRRLPVLRKML